MSSISQISSYPLLIFAHPGEAQVFIKRDRLRKNQEILGLYQGENYHLLITGGGGEKTLLLLTRVLSSNRSNQYTELINLGIAGALSSEIKLFSIYKIATVYAYREGKPVFESFPLIPPCPRTSNICDCITVTSPVSHPRRRQKISPFADIADMELWWLAYVAREFSLSLKAVKIVSDNALSPSQSKNQSRSTLYSQKLYEYYCEKLIDNPSSVSSKNVYKREEKEKIEKIKNKIISDLAKSQGITHFTQSQSQIIDIFITQLIKRNTDKISIEAISLDKRDCIKKIISLLKINNISDVDSPKLNSKEKANQLIQKLKELIFPISQKYQNKIRKLTQVKGIKIDYDPRLESSQISASFTASTLKEWEKKKQALSNVPIKEILSLLDGHDHV